MTVFRLICHCKNIVLGSFWWFFHCSLADSICPRSAQVVYAILLPGHLRSQSRCVAVQPNSTNRDSSSVASTDHSATLPSTAPVGPLPISLSPGILDQLVARMADAVTRRLSPPNETSTTPINNTSRPSALSEVLLVFQPTSTRRWYPIAWYIRCNSRNAWCHGAWVFKHHTIFIVRWFYVLRAVFIDKLSMAIKY